MLPVIGALLPLAIVIAFSPTAVVATLVGLRTSGGMRTAIAIAAGWTGAVTASLALFTLVGAYLPTLGPRNDAVYVATAEIVLGVLLVGLAAWQWMRRRTPNGGFTMPKWVSTIGTMKWWTAASIGFALGAGKPKNLLLSAYAGIILGGADDFTVMLVGAGVYVVVASSAVAVPVVAVLVAPTRATAALDRASAIMVRYRATITSIVLLTLGVAMVGSGIVDL